MAWAGLNFKKKEHLEKERRLNIETELLIRDGVEKSELGEIVLTWFTGGLALAHLRKGRE